MTTTMTVRDFGGRGISISKGRVLDLLPSCEG